MASFVRRKGRRAMADKADPGNGREEIWCTMRSGAGAGKGK